MGPRGRPGTPDSRHPFAVRTLVEWYRDGHDVQALLPRLSTVLGHQNPISTYWYLSAAPELLSLAAARLAAQAPRPCPPSPPPSTPSSHPPCPPTTHPA